MPVGKNETKEQYYKRMTFDLAMAESVFRGELEEFMEKPEEKEIKRLREEVCKLSHQKKHIEKIKQILGELSEDR